MKCINCIDQFGFKRKCCGSISITQQEREKLLSLGYLDNDCFFNTNAGWFTKTKVVGQGTIGEGDGQQTLDVSRCVFLAADGRCSIQVNYGFFNKPAMCKNFPADDVQNDSCGDGGFEETGY